MSAPTREARRPEPVEDPIVMLRRIVREELRAALDLPRDPPAASERRRPHLTAL